MNYIFAIIAYLLILVFVGFYKAKSVKNSDDFMVAGRTLPWYVLVGTLLATWMGSGSLFSGAGLGYRNGLASLWSSGGAWLGIALIYFIANRIRNFGKVTLKSGYTGFFIIRAILPFAGASIRTNLEA